MTILAGTGFVARALGDVPAASTVAASLQTMSKESDEWPASIISSDRQF